MIEVFKTSLTNKQTVDYLLAKWRVSYPLSTITVDLEDCDNVLRVEGEIETISAVPEFLRKNGFSCEVLPD